MGATIRAPRVLRRPQQIRDVLASLLACELICPSERLFLVSPWVSDIPVLRNDAGEFAAMAPSWPRTRVCLSRVLATLAERGTAVHIAITPAEHNAAFVARMRDAAGCVLLLESPTLHEKGLLGDDYYLMGSLSFTVNGITLNDELANLHTDPGFIAENRDAMAQRWEVEP
jgi:hypothetical protein